MIALIRRYTGAVANLTLVISDGILKEGRILALRQDTSVNQLVRAYLEGFVSQAGRRSAARERLEGARLDYAAERFRREETYER